MMIVVKLGRRHEGNMITRVRIKRFERHQNDPEPRRKKVRSKQLRPDQNRQNIRHQMLKRMTISGRDGDRRRPLVMPFVPELVNAWVVETAVAVVEEHFSYQNEECDLQRRPIPMRKALKAGVEAVGRGGKIINGRNSRYSD